MYARFLLKNEARKILIRYEIHKVAYFYSGYWRPPVFFSCFLVWTAISKVYSGVQCHTTSHQQNITVCILVTGAGGDALMDQHWNWKRIPYYFTTLPAGLWTIPTSPPRHTDVTMEQYTMDRQPSSLSSHHQWSNCTIITRLYATTSSPGSLHYGWRIVVSCIPQASSSNPKCLFISSSIPIIRNHGSLRNTHYSSNAIPSTTSPPCPALLTEPEYTQVALTTSTRTCCLEAVVWIYHLGIPPTKFNETSDTTRTMATYLRPGFCLEMASLPQVLLPVPIYEWTMVGICTSQMVPNTHWIFPAPKPNFYAHRHGPCNTHTLPI